MKKKKSLKENPVMVKDKKGKNIKIKDVSVDGEDYEVKRFLIIVLVIALIVGVIYACTELFGNKDKNNADESVPGEINYDLVNVGMILNRPYDEYYVMVYDGDDKAAVKYSALITSYQNKSDDDSLKIYYCDLGNELNKDYYNVGNDNVSNKKPTKVSEFDFAPLTLLKVKNGKVVEYIEDYTTIQEKLK